MFWAWTSLSTQGFPNYPKKILEFSCWCCYSFPTHSTLGFQDSGICPSADSWKSSSRQICLEPLPPLNPANRGGGAAGSFYLLPMFVLLNSWNSIGIAGVRRAKGRCNKVTWEFCSCRKRTKQIPKKIMLEGQNQPCVEIFQEYSILSPSRLCFPLFSAILDEVLVFSRVSWDFFHMESHQTINLHCFQASRN